MSTDVMPADRWHRIAARHVKLKMAVTAKSAALQTELEKAAAANDLQAMVSVVARCNQNVRRLQQIDKVMARHMRRYRINLKIQKRN